MSWRAVGVWPAGEPFDLRLSLAMLRTGAYDPTSRFAEGGFEKAFWTPQGPVTLRLTREGAWALGPGADWCAEHLGPTLAFADGPVPRPEHPVLRERFERMPGLRHVRVPWVSDVAASLVVQQRVTFEEAARSYRQLVRRHGDPSPCGNLHLPPSRAQWLALGVARVQSYNVDAKRALTMLRVADVSRKLDALYAADHQAARRLLDLVPGIGPWTREGVLGTALADPDAVQTGDVWLPHNVTYALTGQRWGSDERMLELLAPYAGYRLKVIRWLMSSP